jgi:hypothetical protein
MKKLIKLIKSAEPSTLRGIIWLIFSLVGLTGWFFDKDLSGLVVLAGAAVGGLGLLPDKA